MTKLSRNFPINDKFFIEPEIRFGAVQTFDEANLGIGIAGKLLPAIKYVQFSAIKDVQKMENKDVQKLLPERIHNPRSKIIIL